MTDVTDTTTAGEATIYITLPTTPDDANATMLLLHSDLLRGAGLECAILEGHGWKPRWVDNHYTDEPFFEFAYEKRFISEADAISEAHFLGVGPVVWDED